MLKLVKAVGWLLVALGAVSLFCVPLVAFDNDAKPDTVFGFLLFTALFGFPGAVILWRGTKLEREQKFKRELAGFVRTHDRFTAEELARKIGRTEMETEALIASIAQEEKFDLVFHRADRSYMHRNRIQTNVRVYDRCPSCGAGLAHEVALEGEQVSCVYCGRVLS